MATRRQRPKETRTEKRKRLARNTRARERRVEAKAAEVRIEKKRLAKNAKARRRRAEAKVAEAKSRAAKKRVVTKKPKRTVKRTKEQLLRELTRTRAQLKKIAEAEQKARREPKRSPVRVKIRKRKRELAKKRSQQTLVTQDLPRATPAEKKESVENNFERMRRRFREKLKYAKETNQLPVIKKIPRKVDNAWNLGEKRQIRIQQILTPNVVEDVLYQVNQIGVTMRGIHPIWHAKIVFSGLGDRLLGSGGKVLEVKAPDPDDVFFQTEGFDSSGIWNTYKGMLNALEVILDQYAALPNTIVYLHYIQLMNFTRK